MKAKFILTSIIATFLLLACNTSSKESGDASGTDFLKGLTKATEADIDPNQEISLDPAVMPIYDEAGKRLNEEEVNALFVSGDYLPEPYIDGNKQVKAFVIRPLTEEEKQMFAEMQSERMGGTDLEGTTALPFSVTDLKGNSYTLEDLKGKIVVINFWFIECKPCIMEMPDLNELVEKYQRDDIVFLAFAPNDKTKLEAFLKQKEFKYQIIPESIETINSYKIMAFPTHLVVDKDGMITHAVTGLSPTTVSDLENEIAMLIE